MSPLSKWARKLNFIRIHIIYFVLGPLVASVIFYLLNGSNQISFVDGLFLCASCMACCGLVTVNIGSELTVAQQIVLYILMILGSQSGVSIVTILIRQYYFRKRFKAILRPSDQESVASAPSIEAKAPRQPRQPIKPELIRRVEGPALVNQMHPSGRISSQLPAKRSYAVEEMGTPQPDAPTASHVHRTPTIGFADPPATVRIPRQMSRSSTHHSVQRSPTIRSRERGMGGFPLPPTLLARLVRRVWPEGHARFQRTLTVTSEPGRGVPFDVVVGRNSAFEGLTEEQREELGGVEYRALKTLSYIVLAYFICCQLIGWAVMAPYSTYVPSIRQTIDEQAGTTLSPIWFSLFQSTSAFLNLGGSLIDASLSAFQTGWAIIFPCAALILAGNTMFPIMLRFIIWLTSRVIPDDSRTSETLHFLLDHPRRCYIYLFPSRQTWWLLFTVLALTLIDWLSFLVLDRGLPAYEAMPTGVPVAVGFVQAVAVRCAGFAVTNVVALAPAMQVLYVVMMFIAAYPLAMSVRSTNVYEARCLGVYEVEDSDEEEEPRHWTAFLGWHLRKQLSADMWFLAVSLWLICIIERASILDPERNYINIFSIIFELVSAYGTIGLSLGVPTNTYSLSGDLGTLSKLLIIAVILRGRHRGLPNAIDRAVLLPSELRRQDAVDDAEAAERSSLHLSLTTARTFTPVTSPAPLEREWDITSPSATRDFGLGLVHEKPERESLLATEELREREEEEERGRVNWEEVPMELQDGSSAPSGRPTQGTESH